MLREAKKENKVREWNKYTVYLSIESILGSHDVRKTGLGISPL